MIHKHLFHISLLPFLTLVFTVPLPCSPAHQEDEIKAGTVKRLEIEDKVFMEFCYIPPGEAELVGQPVWVDG
jgi:hypothetical protein